MKTLLMLMLAPVYVAEFPASRRKQSEEDCNATLPWTVPRKAYHDLQDSVFSALMQCPAELHGCSKGLVRCGPDKFKITCSCALNCKAYRDCCWNVEGAEGTSGSHMSLSACIKIRGLYRQTRFAYMVVGCPPTWAQDDVRLACEQPDSLNGTFYHIPATSINHITYRNGFCALCNDDLVNATFWNAATDSTHQNVKLIIPYEVLKQPALHLRPCVTRTFGDTCPEDAPESVHRKCSTYFAPVQDDLGGQVYRNVYCAICNSANLSSLSCSPAFHARLRWTLRRKMSMWFARTGGGTPHLAALFRPVRTTASCYIEHDGLCYIKHRPGVYSPITTTDGARVATATTASPVTPAVPKRMPSGVYTIHTYVTVVSMSLSICCLIMKIVVFCSWKEARSFSSKCTLCLSLTLLLTQLIFLTTSCFTLSPILCSASAVIAHFGFISTMTWTTVLSYDICRNVTAFKHCSSHERTLLAYGAMSWGFPLCVVASAVVVDKAAPGSWWAPGYGAVNCWLGTSGGLIIYFLVPFVALLFTCVVLYIKTVCYIRRTSSALRRRSQDDSAAARDKNGNLTLFARLAFIMGAVWVLVFVGVFFANAMIDLLIDALVGLEGVYLFFAFRDHQYFCASRRYSRMKAFLTGPRIASRSNISLSKKT